MNKFLVTLFLFVIFGSINAGQVGDDGDVPSDGNRGGVAKKLD